MDTIAKLKIDKWIMKLRCERQRLSQLQVGSLVGVTVKLDHPILIKGKSYPFVVFPTRVTPAFGLEQTSEGVPCDDETSANDFAQVINGKNQTVPHVGLVSAPGFFRMGTLSHVDLCREKLVLFKFHVAKIINGRRCGFALRFYNCFVDKPRELVWEKILPTTNSRDANKLLHKKNAEMNAKDAADKNVFDVADAAAKGEPDLTAMKLKVLSKAYPDTVALLANPNPANAEAVFAAYQRETFVLTGQMVGTHDKAEYAKTAKAMINAIRRKHPAINEVEYQLVAGWRLQGYDRMTPEQRYWHLESIGLHPVSSEAIRKFCERLELPSQRKPGAPRKLNPGN